MTRRPPVTSTGPQALLIVGVFLGCLTATAGVLWLTAHTPTWVWLTATIATFIGSYSVGAYLINWLTGIASGADRDRRREIEANPTEWRWEQTADGGWHSGPEGGYRSGPPQIANPTEPHDPTRGVGEGTPQ